MTRFRFRLETLLKLRRTARDARREELAQAYEAERVLMERAQQLADDIEQSRAQLRGVARPGAIDVDALLAANRFELVLQAQRQQLAEQSRQLADEIERRRGLLIEADRAARVLERLRERKLDEHERRAQSQEIKQLDEIAGGMHLRKSVEAP